MENDANFHLKFFSFESRNLRRCETFVSRQNFNAEAKVIKKIVKTHTIAWSFRKIFRCHLAG